MNITDQSRRLVLASGFADTGFEQFIAGYKWPFLYTLPPQQDIEVKEYVWSVDPEHTFHYFECMNYPVEYCLVVGPQANTVLMDISASLDFLDVDDLAYAFDVASTPDEKRLTVYTLGLSAGANPDSVIFDRIQQAMSDANVPVRLAAIDAAFVTGWKTFNSQLENLLKNDPEPLVRQTAAYVLEAISSTNSK